MISRILQKLDLSAIILHVLFLSYALFILSELSVLSVFSVLPKFFVRFVNAHLHGQNENDLKMSLL